MSTFIDRQKKNNLYPVLMHHKFHEDETFEASVALFNLLCQDFNQNRTLQEQYNRTGLTNSNISKCRTQQVMQVKLIALGDRVTPAGRKKREAKEKSSQQDVLKNSFTAYLRTSMTPTLCVSAVNAVLESGCEI